MQLPSKQRTGLAVAAAIAVVAITAAVVVATTRADKPPALLPPTPCGTSTGKGCAPDSDRVDLQRPSFTHPTDITNPLFPISTLKSAVLLGRVDGKPFRSETTLLPETTTVDWDGQRIEVALSQYVAYLDGRIQEIALDRYAQADDGSVWYLGEDVFDYEDGSVAVSEGTWLAGRDGPPAMIMPAYPQPGQAFRAENITGVVFEELRVRDVDLTVDGPSGKVPGAVTMDELHVDGVTVSGKTFAPGYGEFLTLDKPDVEALAIAHGTDRRPGPTPDPITHLVTAAWGVLEQLRLEDWEAAARGAALVRADRSALQHATLPPLVLDQLDVAIHDLQRATTAKDPDAGADAAIRVAQSALDLQLLTRAPVAVDIERVHLHAQALRVAAAAGDKPGVNADRRPRLARRPGRRAPPRHRPGRARGSPARASPQPQPRRHRRPPRRLAPIHAPGIGLGAAPDALAPHQHHRPPPIGRSRTRTVRRACDWPGLHRPRTRPAWLWSAP